MGCRSLSGTFFSGDKPSGGIDSKHAKGYRVVELGSKKQGVLQFIQKVDRDKKPPIFKELTSEGTFTYFRAELFYFPICVGRSR
ncbi:hypothetical protein ES705_29718 [subsurface metagenome]